MGRGVTGTNETLSGSKVAPLDAELKKNVSHDKSLTGSIGTDHIGHSRIPPLGDHGRGIPVIITLPRSRLALMTTPFCIFPHTLLLDELERIFGGTGAAAIPAGCSRINKKGKAHEHPLCSPPVPGRSQTNTSAFVPFFIANHMLT